MSNKRLFRLSLQFFGDGGEAQGVASDGGDAGFELTPRMAELQKKYGIDFDLISKRVAASFRYSLAFSTSKSSRFSIYCKNCSVT